MFLLKEPSDEEVRQFLSAQGKLPFSYGEVGAPREDATADLPPGYAVDRYHMKLGAGTEAYARAVEALRRWRPFELRWVRLLPPRVPSEVGMPVGILAWHAGFWSLNHARVAYLVEETGDVERFGYGYATLPSHAERDEERFGVEWNRQDDSVHYDVFAFSRPNHPLAWIGYPLPVSYRGASRGTRRGRWSKLWPRRPRLEPCFVAKLALR
jgi:uncharacterized protein (UPF0548 family)